MSDAAAGVVGGGPPLAPGESRQERHRENTALLGMVLFISSWAMLFAGLFFAYGLIRVRAVSWPPLDLPRLPLGVPAVATLLLGLSSASLVRAVRGGRRGRRAALPVFAAALLGVGFLALQVVVWRQLYLAGMRPTGGSYASVFYGLTVFHALHVIVGLVALVYLGMRAALAAALAGSAPLTPFWLPLRLWTIYWHMVGVIWAVMFFAVYLV